MDRQVKSTAAIMFATQKDKPEHHHVFELLKNMDVKGAKCGMQLHDTVVTKSTPLEAYRVKASIYHAIEEEAINIVGIDDPVEFYICSF